MRSETRASRKEHYAWRGAVKQTQPAPLADDLAKLVAKGVRVYLVEEDVAERGIDPSELIAGLEPVSRAGVAKLFAAFDQVWHW